MAITHLLILADEMADLPPTPQYCLLMIKNCSYTFTHIGEMKWQIYWQIFPLVLPSSDQEWQLHIYSYWQMKWQIYPPPSDQEWQLHISTVRTHIGR